MPLSGNRLVEQIEQKFRRIPDCLEKKTKKTSDCNSRAFLFNENAYQKHMFPKQYLSSKNTAGYQKFMPSNFFSVEAVNMRRLSARSVSQNF